jgi:predicted DNA-binding transcriptional regulator AlpA
VRHRPDAPAPTNPWVRARPRGATPDPVEPSNTAIEPLLSTRETAALLCISPRTLEAWRGRGQGPPFVRLGGRRGYRRADVAAWVEAQTSSPPGAAPRSGDDST